MPDLLQFGGVTNTASSVASVSWAGISTIAGGLSIAGVVVDAITLPINFLVIAKGVYDIHMYRMGHRTNSRKALELEAIIKKLEEDKERILQIKEALDLRHQEPSSLFSTSPHCKNCSVYGTPKVWHTMAEV